MGRLPNELIVEICRQLCPHCSKSSDQDGGDVLDLRQMAKKISAEEGGRAALDLLQMRASMEGGSGASGDMGGRFVKNYLEQQASSQDALAKMCRASKTFFDIATPFLYHCLSEGRGTYQRTTYFLSVIARKPELAACVRSFCPVLCDFQRENASGLMHFYDPFKIPRDLGIRCPSYPFNRTIDAFLVGLAWAAKNVEEILINPRDLKLDSEDPDPVWYHLPYGGFRSLRSLELRAHDKNLLEIEWGVGVLALLLNAAPRLETLKLKLDCPFLSHVDEEMPELDTLNTVRSLTVTGSALDEDGLNGLVGLCPALEEFNYRPYWSDVRPMTPTDRLIDLSPYQTVTELFRRRNTLKRIYLDQSWRFNHPNERVKRLTSRKVMGSFVRFTALEHLTVHISNVIPNPSTEWNSQLDAHYDLFLSRPDLRPPGYICGTSSQDDDVDTDDDGQDHINDEEQEMKPARTEMRRRFCGLVPPSLKTLTILGCCPFTECQSLSDAKAFGQLGDSLEKVTFGDVVRVAGSYTFPGVTRREIKRIFENEAGVECEILALQNGSDFY